MRLIFKSAELEESRPSVIRVGLIQSVEGLDRKSLIFLEEERLLPANGFWT